MRVILLGLLCACCLSSCVYYGDLHSQSSEMKASELVKPQTYPVPKHTVATANSWWKQFHDPQLTQLINVALADSPDMQIAQARVQRATAMADEAFATLWPSVDLSGYATRERFSKSGLVPPPFNGKTFNITDLGLSFNYEFDFWGKNRQLLAAKVSEICAAEADQAQARLVISTAVALTYFQLLNDIAQVNVAKANQQAAEKVLQIVTARAQTGINSDIPVKQVQSDAESAKRTTAAMQQAEMLARHQLAALIGKNALVTNIKTREFNYHYRKLTIPSNLTVNVLAHRPDIAASKARAEAAAHHINVAKARFFPDITLSALFSYQTAIGHLFEPGNQNNAITGAIDLPLFDAGARRANLSAKYAEYDVAVNNYNQTLLTALREVADQLSNLKTVRTQLDAQDEAVAATKHQYKLYVSRYNHGVNDYLPVLIAKEALLKEQAAQIHLQTNQMQTVVAMFKALGGSDFSKQG